MSAPFRPVEARITGGDPGCDQLAELLPDVLGCHLGGYTPGEPRRCGSGEYATPGNEAAHDRSRCRQRQHARRLLNLRMQSDNDSPAVFVFIRDHLCAARPTFRGRWRLELPPIGSDIELVETRQHRCHGVLPQLAMPAGDDLEQQLASLCATGRSDSQEAALLGAAQLGRIVRVILTLTLDDDVRGPLQETDRKAPGLPELE